METGKKRWDDRGFGRGKMGDGMRGKKFGGERGKRTQAVGIKASGGKVPAELKDAGRGERLQKVLAALGVASRRACEEIILQGRVRVNGQAVTGLPAWANAAEDQIEIDGRLVNRLQKKKRIEEDEGGARASSERAKVGRKGAGKEQAGAGEKGREKSAGKSGVNSGGQSGGVYVMLNKPRQTISTTADPDQRRNVLDLVDMKALGEMVGVGKKGSGLSMVGMNGWGASGGMYGGVRLFPVGRLDADSTGMILLTNDGELAHRLTHPSFGVSKTYLVSVKGWVEEEHLAQLRDGLYLAQKSGRGRGEDGYGEDARGSRRGVGKGEGERGEQGKTRDRGEGQQAGGGGGIKRVRMDKVRLVDRQRDRSRGDRTVLEVTLHEGHNRVIRRMLARVGLKVRRLQRTGIGPVKLKALGIGRWRLLLPGEIKALKKVVGL